jgi:hypothetical protein
MQSSNLLLLAWIAGNGSPPFIDVKMIPLLSTELSQSTPSSSDEEYRSGCPLSSWSLWRRDRSSSRLEQPSNYASSANQDATRDLNFYGSVSSGVLRIKGILRDLRFVVEPESSDLACLFYTLRETRGAVMEQVLLDAPWEDGVPSGRTFPCFAHQSKEAPPVGDRGRAIQARRSGLATSSLSQLDTRRTSTVELDGRR